MICFFYVFFLLFLVRCKSCTIVLWHNLVCVPFVLACTQRACTACQRFVVDQNKRSSWHRACPTFEVVDKSVMWRQREQRRDVKFRKNSSFSCLPSDCFPPCDTFLVDQSNTHHCSTIFSSFLPFFLLPSFLLLSFFLFFVSQQLTGTIIISTWKWWSVFNSLRQ